MLRLILVMVLSLGLGEAAWGQDGVASGGPRGGADLGDGPLTADPVPAVFDGGGESTPPAASGFGNSRLVNACREYATGAEGKRKAEDLKAAGVQDAYVAPKLRDLHDKGGADQAGGAAMTGDIASGMNSVMAVYTRNLLANCETLCIGEQAKLDQNDKALPVGKASSQMKNYFNDYCHEKIAKWIPIYESGKYGAAASAAMAKKARGSLLTKVAIGGALAGGGLIIKDQIDDKNDRKKKEKEEKAKFDAENGVIKDANGNDLVCFSEGNFMRAECKATMLGLCQAGKADTAGCKAFNNNHCAVDGAQSSYCLAADAKTYCAQTGDMIAKSPACQWASSRGEACKKDPENVSCLYAGSASALTAACAGFPNDPLCRAHAEGRIVSQGGGSAAGAEYTAAAAEGAGANANAEEDGATVTMSSILGGSSSSSAGSSVQDSSVLSTTESLWANSIAVTQKACAEGLLKDCGN